MVGQWWSSSLLVGSGAARLGTATTRADPSRGCSLESTVLQRGPVARWSGYWAPLSGKVEAVETQEEALIREVQEEVGLDVSPLAKVWESETEDSTFRLH